MQIPDVNSEEYYAMRDEFMRYIQDHVNPARATAGLERISDISAKECYRILYEFWQRWEKKF